MFQSPLAVAVLAATLGTSSFGMVAPALAGREPAVETALANSAALTSVFEHPHEDTSAATLYVRQIPVLTFVNTGDSSGSDPSSPVKLAGERANAVAARVQQLGEDFDAGALVVRWEREDDTYRILAGDEELVRLSDREILPDTTGDRAQDALQATNRLRRLLGGAEPLTAVAGRPRPETVQVAQAVRKQLQGVASWYGPGFHGRPTASGERFNSNDLTAAHRSLPFGTKVRVTNTRNGQSVIVRINDRGPFTGGRVIDLSAAAAREIGLVNSGIGPVRIDVLGR
ncbi:septal ring lytic transglycosylase RlpA family protein [Rubidibacter lacunae]|nr:septal ring lytic transglycosylase RlpA family protein [Rubidibacter lacunae]